VSRLVILHEEAEDGNAMPDLSRPVKAVSIAVTNLVKVGRETINSSDDEILKQDMPSSLLRVENASQLLEGASTLLRSDPFSGPARKKLIEGSRGILQGTSQLLLCFDESEVRKIVRECKRVLDYLAVSEVIDSMEDLVQFLKDLSPCLSKVSREVGNREKELTHQVHSEILVRCLEQVKILAPILICSMKVYIHIVEQGGKGSGEAAENRNYLAARMSDEIQEIIRVLQLTTYDEDTSELDSLTVLKKIQSAIRTKMEAAKDWLKNPYALKGGIGEKALRQIIENAYIIADSSLPSDAYRIRKNADDLTAMANALCELRQDGKGTSSQAETLSREMIDKLAELDGNILQAVINVDKAGLLQAAHTVNIDKKNYVENFLSNNFI
jgi:vinculin